jgi:protein-S-isoprenylcysteine O-methyltransferase Ste14
VVEAEPMATGVEVLNPVQFVRKIALGPALLAAVALISLVGSPPDWAAFHEDTESVGLALMLICIAGRCWCTLYIGGRKGAELVDVGPYSISRNPLYIFSFIGAAGVGAQTGSVTVAAGVTIAVWVVFRIVVAREEAFLKTALGAPYDRYLASVPRFMLFPWLWTGVEVLEVRRQLVVLTFFDGLAFLLAIPLAEGLEMLQNHRVLPVLLRLP